MKQPVGGGLKNRKVTKVIAQVRKPGIKLLIGDELCGKFSKYCQLD